MSTPGYGSFSLTGDSLVDGMTHGYYWILSADRAIDFSVSNGFQGEYWNNVPVTNNYVNAAINFFGAYANIKFNNLGNYSTPAAANTAGSEINITLSGNKVLFPSSNIWAKGFFDPNASTIYPGQVGDVYLNINSQANYLPSFEPGSSGWALLLHELGHTLGLKHPHDDGGTGRPTFSQLGDQALNVDWATIMSYNDSYSWNLIAYDPATPMILDVLALQYLYGKNLATNAEDTFFSLVQTNYFSTIWDASGNDTVSASGSNINWTIALPSLTLSKLVDTKTGFAAPTNDVALVNPQTLYWLAGDIENAQGGSGNDVITGNSANNLLNGGLGSDTLDGGTGLDYAVYTNPKSSYTITKNTTDYSVIGAEGSDTLKNIDRIQFSNETLALDINGTAGQAYRIYQAAFNRTPDNGGLKYWIGIMDGGVSLSTVSSGFIGSAEFQKLYGANPNNELFVTKLYDNVLHRTPDTGGYNYWVGLLNSGGIDKISTLVNFSESNENQVGVIGIIQNGINLFN